MFLGTVPPPSFVELGSALTDGCSLGQRSQNRWLMNGSLKITGKWKTPFGGLRYMFVSFTPTPSRNSH
jgi:hypothetical protein